MTPETLATVEPGGAPGSELARELRRAGVRDVDETALTRILYSSDASLYRVPPRVVVRPHDADEVLACAQVSRALAVPITPRGAGTSIAGNAVGPGIVLDFSKHMSRLLDFDTEAGTATVEPGIVQATLQRLVAPGGWRFGPDPSTHNRCTIGGMVGNNSCGSRALGYGRTSDNVHGLKVITGTGERLGLGSLATIGSESPILAGLRQLTEGSLATIRTELGRFGRQVSGYSLEHLLPERGFDVARALVGSEGTLGITVAAQVRLVQDSPHRILIALGYPSMEDAADAVPAVLPFAPVACEGLDSRIVDIIRGRRGQSSVPDLPRGAGWLFVELAGDDLVGLLATADRLTASAQALESRVLTDRAEMARVWKIREDGAGLVARTTDGRPNHAGWEDAAVPPEKLGPYLREFGALLTGYGLAGVPYGHFGDGCVHIRIDFALGESAGRAQFREFLLDAAKMVARYGGSMSGEHGDGRARSELLPMMYSPAALTAFADVKRIFDPDDLLNPGVIVRPHPLDADLRLAAVSPHPSAAARPRQRLALTYRHDHGDLAAAVHRCTGVGKCLADTPTDTMCPSFLATREEKDSTRGRARVLQEAMAGHLGPAGLAAPEVREALDLCLSCKGCSSDCPTGVDMASYKAEALHQQYRWKLRPRSHYALGWLPLWARLTAPVAGLANRLMSIAAFRSVLVRLAGVDPRRELPKFATKTFRSTFDASPSKPVGALGNVVLFVDTFANYFTPDGANATVHVLESAGWNVHLTRRQVCCGLTLISTGQLGAAKTQMQRTIDELLPHVRAGRLIVGVEPSCTAAIRSDAAELLGTPAADEVAAATFTLAELLARTPDYVPPALTGTHVVAQPHCHHHAVLGWSTDAQLLAAAGADVQQLGGCCGLAGNFGVEKGHHDISVRVAEQQLLPAVRAAGSDAVVLADGFSCRTQIASLLGTDSVHLAQLLARDL